MDGVGNFELTGKCRLIKKIYAGYCKSFKVAISISAVIV